MIEQLDGILKLSHNKFAVVLAEGKEYHINNWYGTKKKFKIHKKDLPIKCKGAVNKFRYKLFNKYYEGKNFIITSILE